MAALAKKTGAHSSAIDGLCIWGNHSSTQYPDLHRATVAGASAMNLIDMAWYEGEFIPSVQQRGAAIIEARGASSAASAANAAVEHLRDWALGSPAVLSMGVRSDGGYGVAEGLIYSYPMRCRGGDWQILDGIVVNDFSRARMQATFDGKRWQGDIYDPEGGGTYTSRLWVDAGGDLRVRSYLGIPLLGRTAVFKPVSLCADHIAEKLEKAGLSDCGTPTAPTALESARQ